MKISAPKALVVVAASLGLAVSSGAAIITSVVETGGDNEASDTISARYTGQTWNVTVANEPVAGAVVGSPYTVGAFGHLAPAFVDRGHAYANDPGTGGGNAQPIPTYLLGLEYIMSGNDNRDNTGYRLDITLSSAARIYMLVDNRLTDANNANPPTFDATHMQWMLNDGWLATNNGLNRVRSAAVPDEVAIDEVAIGDINQWYSVYYKDFAAGTASVFQADNTGQNMYGVIVGPIPEPAAVSMSGILLSGLLLRRRR